MTLQADGCLSVCLFQLELDISGVSIAFWYVGSCHDFAWRFNARKAPA
jgi:hypothetical protein